MSDDSIISDTGDINEGEGVKVVQSSIMIQSVMRADIGKGLVSKIEEKKKDGKSEEIQKPAENKQKTELKVLENKSKIVDNLKLSTPQYQKSSSLIPKSSRTPKIKTIPVLNKDTANPNTFDLNYLLHPEVQKIAKSGHRLTQSNTVSATGSFVNTKTPTNAKDQSARSLYNSVSSKSFLEPSKPASKKPKVDIDERFYKKAKQTEDKVKTLKEIKDQEEINSCTFHPTIKTKRKTKTCEEYFDYMKKFTERKDKKVSQLREDKDKESKNLIDYNHQPKICEKSIQIAAQRQNSECSTFDRLHNDFKLKNSSCEPVGENLNLSSSQVDSKSLFQPRVNKKSHAINRTDSISQILYDDAVRRQGQNKKTCTPKSQKLITNSSEKVLIDKLKRDFYESFSKIDIDQSDSLNYTKMIEVLKMMNMVQDSYKREEERLLMIEAWKHLTTESSSFINKSSLLSFVIAVMGFHETWMSENTNFSLTPKSSKKFHQQFNLLYLNRTTTQHKFSTSRIIKDQTEHSFHPQLSSPNKAHINTRTSIRLNGKIEDHLIAEKERIAKKIEEKRMQLDEEKMGECSFHPLIEDLPESCKVSRSVKEDLTSEYYKHLNSPNFQYKHKGVFLHDISKVFKEKKKELESIHREKELKKELEVCTFMPVIERRVASVDFTMESFHDWAKKGKKNEGRFGGSFVETHSDFREIEKIIEEPKSKENPNSFFNLVKCMKGVATISISTEKSKEVFKFNFKEEDPACVVLEVSSRLGLSKDQEYKLVKELTLIKYKNL